MPIIYEVCAIIVDLKKKMNGQLLETRMKKTDKIFSPYGIGTLCEENRYVIHQAF